MNNNSKASFGFDEEYHAVIVLGRRISLDDLEASELSQRQIKNLGVFAQTWAEKTGLPLAYVHMGTTANWDEDDDSTPEEGADAIIGLALASASFAEGPVQVSLADLAAANAAQVPDEFWKALADEHSISATDEGLYLAPAGWTIAEIYPGSAEYDKPNECFANDAQPLLQSCSEDFPPGAALSLDGLPEKLWLRAFYA